ncbi:hypothetical protein QYE76_003482 [Lolium multiflorum]|uniref:RNase H type-1 domain-containing protein n=1 Tax=Lolium multiflorum TaxID=4521 RepID=A0AAD8RQV1_LOLMU|nr:hypothetical protein QYE76_003482 [Lolium multiflorum]
MSHMSVDLAACWSRVNGVTDGRQSRPLTASSYRCYSQTDSQLLVQALKNNDDDFGPCGVLIKEIKETLYLNFFCFSVEYCPRACNSVADALAAFGSKLRDETQTVWSGHAPDFVLVHVNSDVAVPV